MQIPVAADCELYWAVWCCVLCRNLGFYDYMSLFQFKRQSAAQDGSFKRSMDDMHVLYAHEFTRTLRIQSLTPEDVWNRMLESKEGVPVFHEGSGDVKARPLRDLVANPTPYEGHFG